VDTTRLVVQPSRGTLLKRRVLADGQLLVRLDEGDEAPVRGRAARRLADHLAESFAAQDAVLVSDYAAGTVGSSLITAWPTAGDRAPDPRHRCQEPGRLRIGTPTAVATYAVTVIVMSVGVVLLPAASMATALSVWVPSATLLAMVHEMEYGDDESVPSCLVPSR
jgi:hypothetical protein